MRQKLVAANWKMNGNRETVGKLVQGLNAFMRTPRCDVVLAPGYLHMGQVFQELDLMNVAIAGQNCSQYLEGPFTGEVSAKMLADFGCE